MPLLKRRTQKKSAQGFFDDLLTMEVNVILKPGMTARKMPSTLEAFFDVADKYADYLRDATDDIRTAKGAPVETGVSPSGDAISETGTGTPPPTPPPTTTGQIGVVPSRKDCPALSDAAGSDFGRATFQLIEKRAADLRNINDDLGEAGKPRDVILSRIVRNSRLLKDLYPEKKTKVPSQGDWDLLTKHKIPKEGLVTLRKAWEVGTESVVMQTVAQVDGDIVTRVRSDKVGAEHAPIHDVHHHMVGESLQHWRFLFATVASFTLGVFRSFFPRGG